MPAPTIIDLKAAFLRSQILGLSRPLQPSADWARNASADNALRQKHIDEALVRLNALLRQHSRAVYPPQGVRHVAEQIDALYWGEDGEGGAVLAERELTRDADIEGLPDVEDVEGLDAPLVERYGVARDRLVALSARRREVRARLEGLRVLRERLGPFVDPKEDVQMNLCTRDGEVGVELERMKVLLLRVGARVGALEGKGKEEVVIGDEDGKTDLQEVLRLMDVD